MVVELGRSRVLHDALSPARHLEVTQSYARGAKPPIALVAAVGLARHSVRRHTRNNTHLPTHPPCYSSLARYIFLSSTADCYALFESRPYFVPNYHALNIYIYIRFW